MNHLGFPLDVTAAIGVEQLISTVLYVIPSTTVIGAILLTGHLGGAVASHIRGGDPAFESYIFPVFVGVLIWGALLLVTSRLRAVLSAGQ